MPEEASSRIKDSSTAGKSSRPKFIYQDAGHGTVVLVLEGAWTKDHSIIPEVVQALESFSQQARVERLEFEAQGVQAWDSCLVTVLLRLEVACRTKGIVLDLTGLPPGAMRLVDLATARPAPERFSGKKQSGFVLEAVRRSVFALATDARDFLEFLGQFARAFIRFVFGLSSFRKRDLWVLLRECSVQALHIVALVNLLLGLILAFVGAVQLKQFGAQIYVANLVTVSMTREMGAIMTGIIMAGRTGAAYAAHLGTMNVNEEVDALRTLGFSPVEFLVVPRVIALVCMMPLLCLYADFMGIMGGLCVAVGLLDLPFRQFIQEAGNSFSFIDLGLGLFKSFLFGLLVALAGCFQGLQAQRNAAAVGLAATSAVVTATVAIIATDGIVAVLCNILGI
ncbi:MAG: ABC transporter permease [Thermodesulfobacteriota bacterium]